MQSNIPHILLYILAIFFCLQVGYTQNIKSKTILKKDSLLLYKVFDTIKKDSLSPKSSVESIITHYAKDSIVEYAKNKRVELYNEAHITYDDIDLKAGIIIVDYKRNTIFAKGVKDSLEYKQRPVFKQGGQDSEQDSILYNFKSKRALIYGLETTQIGMVTYGEKTKRVNDSTVFIRNIRFTTSKKKNPDYYIKTSKAKLVPGKKIIVGLSNLVIADVPTPIAVPFAYFPMSDKRASGLIIPTWGESNSRGYFLQNGGYYLAINDYLDITLLGDVYTNGSWGLRANSNYVVRYKYKGNFSLSFENLIRSLKGFDDYGKSTNFNIKWSHTPDSKSNPNSRFGVSVNFGSSKYYKESINQRNISDQLKNTLGSSINYSKTFVGTPFNMSVNLSHQQNVNTGKMMITFPSLTLNMRPIYPFAGKGGAKKNAFQKIGLNYGMSGEYRINTVDSLFLKPEMFKSAKAGVKHNASFSTNMKVFRYFTLSPSTNYEEIWNFDYINKRYDASIVNKDETLGAVVTDTIRGFKSFREYRAGVSLGTNIYGVFNFKKSALKSIRHTVTPSISYGYKPDFEDKYNEQVQQSEDPMDLLTYSPFQNGNNRPSGGLSSSIGITLNNRLEAKIASKDSTEVEDKKIILLNNLNFSTGYNFAKDSVRWSPITVSAGTKILNDKLSINMNATLNLYQIDSTGNQIDKFNTLKDRLFRVTRVGASANYSISSKDFKKKKTKKSSNNKSSANQFGEGSTDNSNENEQNKTEEEETELYRASVPWTLNFSYSANYSNNGITSGIGANSLTFGGDIELSPKWKVRFSSGYDFKGKGFSYTNLGFSRDLDSWDFNFDWSPFGNNKSYYFRIGIRSSLLSDLKWDKRSIPDRRLF